MFVRSRVVVHNTTQVCSCTRRVRVEPAAHVGLEGNVCRLHVDQCLLIAFFSSHEPSQWITLYVDCFDCHVVLAHCLAGGRIWPRVKDDASI